MYICVITYSIYFSIMLQNRIFASQRKKNPSFEIESVGHTIGTINLNTYVCIDFCLLFWNEEFFSKLCKTSSETPCVFIIIIFLVHNPKQIA